MKLRTLSAVFLSVSLLSGCGHTADMDVTITVPANSELDYFWADEEISPGRNKLIFETPAGTPDSKIAIQVIEVDEDMLYLPSEISPESSVSFDAEKGGWYKIGMMFENTTDKDITYTVNVKDIEVRIEENENQ